MENATPPQAELPPTYIDPSVNQKFDREDPMDTTQTWRELQAIGAKRDLTPSETALMVEVTRILRKTNTGPAKTKTAKKKSNVTKSGIDVTQFLLGD